MFMSISCYHLCSEFVRDVPIIEQNRYQNDFEDDIGSAGDWIIEW